MELIYTATENQHGMVLLYGDEVWQTFCLPWYAVFEWLRWWLTPGKRAWICLTVRDGQQKVRVRAVRLSRTHVKMPKLNL